MNVCEIAEKIVHLAKNAPKTTTWYRCHGEPHSYATKDWDAVEIAIQELLSEEIKNEI